MSIIFNLSGLSPDIRATIENSPKLVSLFSRKPDRMLAIGSDAKTVKGEKQGFLTAILYLAPYNLSGNNVCAMASLAQCDKACLNTAGRGKMSNVQFARLRKTLFLFQYKNEAIELIKSEIATANLKALKKNMPLLVRLNGTSDIRFENYGIMQAFPNIQFYDYTKLHNRKNIPANYDLTFSYSGIAAYKPYVQKALEAGMRIAAVFRSRSIVLDMLEKAETFLGLPLVDGDNTDIRHLDPAKSVVALYAKGKAKLDYSGFVVG